MPSCPSYNCETSVQDNVVLTLAEQAEESLRVDKTHSILSSTAERIRLAVADVKEPTESGGARQVVHTTCVQRAKTPEAGAAKAGAGVEAATAGAAKVVAVAERVHICAPSKTLCIDRNNPVLN